MEYVYSIVGPECISATDLQQTMQDEPGEWVCADVARVEDDGYIATNCEAIYVIYSPEHNRAGIAEGADAVWTDAYSVEDAIERYLGVGGKETRN